MLNTCALILPVLIPSWRFFQTIEPSPRVEWTLIPDPNTPATNWHPFRPRPKTMTPLQMLCRLFWNPAGNEALFVVSCAERIALERRPHAIQEIAHRILSDLAQSPDKSRGQWMLFRLAFVHRDVDGPTHQVLFVSDPIAV